MISMKGDMGGGAAVVGAFCGLAALAPRVEVRGYVPLTDNMTGGDAMRLGDVLRISNGKTVEIHNTDAEGRLVLADALSRASAAKPDAIIDLATLTGACMVALGDDRAGVMGSHDGWVDQVLAAGEASGEKSWRLPMPVEWRPKLDSDVADMKNIASTRYGGASIAGLFLREFVGEGIPWAHIDIAGPAFATEETVLQTKGGTGYGVRTLLALLKGFSKPR
jgi:leucyl aminopeptidase